MCDNNDYYQMYEFMFDLKVAYKKYIELYSCNKDHFNHILCSKNNRFILCTYDLFIAPINSQDININIHLLYKSINRIGDNHLFIDVVSGEFRNTLCNEYSYHNESKPSLWSGKFFLNNPHLSHKHLFYKKIDEESYFMQFYITPSYHRMDLFANYEDVVYYE